MQPTLCETSYQHTVSSIFIIFSDLREVTKVHISVTTRCFSLRFMCKRESKRQRLGGGGGWGAPEGLPYTICAVWLLKWNCV